MVRFRVQTLLVPVLTTLLSREQIRLTTETASCTKVFKIQTTVLTRLIDRSRSSMTNKGHNSQGRRQLTPTLLSSTKGLRMCSGCWLKKLTIWLTTELSNVAKVKAWRSSSESKSTAWESLSVLTIWTMSTYLLTLFTILRLSTRGNRIRFSQINLQFWKLLQRRQDNLFNLY